MELTRKEKILVANANKTLSKALRIKVGKRIYHEVNRLKSLNLSWSIGSFWVVKKCPGYHRGDKVFDRKLVEEMTAKGAKFRPILCYNKETNKQLHFLAEMLDIPCEWQHGFTHGKGVITAVNDIVEKEGLFGVSKVFIDLQDAFNQITENEVRALLHVTFRLNLKDADWLAHRMCYKGNLFQGNPVAPLLFNVFSRYIGYNVQKQSKGLIKLVQYADDLTFIIQKDYTPKSLIKFIFKMINWAQFKCNPAKTEKRKAGSKWGCLGLYHDGTGMKIRGQRKLKKKIMWFYHMIKLKTYLSLRRNKIGINIPIPCIIKGLAEWYSCVYKNTQSSKHSHQFMSKLYQIKKEIASIKIKDCYKENFRENFV